MAEVLLSYSEHSIVSPSSKLAGMKEAKDVGKAKTTTKPFPKKSNLVVISGGAPGADRALLRAAQAVGIPTIGFAPRKLEYDGVSYPELKEKYNLVEIDGGHATKDKMNIDKHNPDMLFVHRIDLPNTGNGTVRTRNYAMYGKYWVYGEKDDKTRKIIDESLDEKFGMAYEGDDYKSVSCHGDKMTLVEMWNVTDNKAVTDFTKKEKVDLVLDLYTDMEESRSSRFMITGPTEKNGRCEDLLTEIYTMAFRLYMMRLE